MSVNTQVSRLSTSSTSPMVYHAQLRPDAWELFAGPIGDDAGVQTTLGEAGLALVGKFDHGEADYSAAGKSSVGGGVISCHC